MEVLGRVLYNFINLTSLPEDLQVGHQLYIGGAALEENSDEEIKAMLGPTGFIKGEILA